MTFLIAARCRYAVIALLCLVVLAIYLPVAQAQTYCPLYGVDGAVNKRIKFEPDYVRGTAFTYQDSACTAANGFTTSPSGGWAYSTTSSGAQAVCRRELGSRATAEVDANSLTSAIWICRVPRQRSSSVRDEEEPPVKPYIPTGILLNETDLRLSAQAGLSSGIEFQRLDSLAVGIPTVIAMGVLDVVDVWGKVDGPYTVCFPQSGDIYFLDAAMAPRTVSQIASYTDGSYTCADMDRPGTLVLVEAEGPTVTELEVSPGLPGDYSARVALEDCEVTPRYNVHHRVEPAGLSRGLVPAEITLAASQRTELWFEVEYGGNPGWISAWWVVPQGECEHPLPTTAG